MLVAQQGEEAIEIVQEVVEAADVAPRALRAPVSLLIEGVDGAAPRGEPGSEALVAPAVLRVAVDHAQHPLGRLRKPGAAEQGARPGPGEVSLRPADRGVHRRNLPDLAGARPSLASGSLRAPGGR